MWVRNDFSQVFLFVCLSVQVGAHIMTISIPFKHTKGIKVI